MGFTAMLAVLGAAQAWGAGAANAASSDADEPLLDLFVQKGFVTQAEAEKVKAQADAMRTNRMQMPAMPASQWKISPPIKGMELYGDFRLRYEDRSAEDPAGDQIDLQRFRYAVRLGLRGDLFDQFYYGLRLDTGQNPRSPFVTFGTAATTSSTSGYYQGPFGKSQGGINVGQVYLGWHPEDWIDLTAGKMPNPLFTSTMVWSPNISPEGLAERFKYTVGSIDFFANFSQFIYQDMNPAFASGILQSSGLGQDQNNDFMVAWQGGLTYHITSQLTAKVAGTIYSYYGLKRSMVASGSTTSPYYGDPYVGEGQYAGAGATGPGVASYSTYGVSGFGTAGNTPGDYSLNYPNNQVGLNDLLVLEIPFQVDYKCKGMDAHVFGDYAYNLKGKQRADAAATGYANYLNYLNSLPGGKSNPKAAFPPQTHDVKAYQIGFGLGSDDVVYGPTQGLVYGTSSPRHAWEVRAYWQHVEQYSLDPNLLDLDFFNGVENLQGIYVAAAYAFTGNFIGTFRYGHAGRINNKLGTGGSSGDIPQINPIGNYDIYQVDLTFRF